VGRRRSFLPGDAFWSTGGRPLSAPTIITHVKIKAIANAEGSNVWYIRMSDLLSRESLLLEEFLRDMADFIVRFCQFCGQRYETTPVEAVSLNDVKYYKHGLHCFSNYNLYFVLEYI
jgi:hypothetical protein